MLRALLVLMVAYSVQSMAAPDPNSVQCELPGDKPKSIKVLQDDGETFSCLPAKTPYPCKHEQYWDDEAMKCLAQSHYKNITLVERFVQHEGYVTKKSCPEGLEHVGFTKGANDKDTWVCVPSMEVQRVAAESKPKPKLTKKQKAQQRKEDRAYKADEERRIMREEHAAGTADETQGGG